MKHPEKVFDNETPFETGERLSYLRYDALENLLKGIMVGLGEQAKQDKIKNRIQLANLGEKTAIDILEVTKEVEKMWRISKPHMNKEE